MGLKISVHIFLPILLQLLGLSLAQTNFIAHYCNFDYNVNYTSNSLFKKNLDTLPSLLTSNASFYNFTVGESEKVNVIALCRGDVTPDTCNNCLQESNNMLRELCPSEKESIGWSDYCMLRYSDRPILNNVSTLPNAYAYNLMMAKNVKKFNMVLRSLLDGLSDKASKGDSVIKLASGNMSFGSNDEMIYGLVQCTPDLEHKQCSECLNASFGYLSQCCDGKIGGRVLMPSCNFRYEIGKFYNETLKTSMVPPSQPTETAPPADALRPPPSQSANGGAGGQNNASLLILSAIVGATVMAIFYL